MQYALLVDGVVRELIPTGDVPIDQRYHPDFVAGLAEVDDAVREGWVWDGAAFAPPLTPATAPVVPQEITRRQMLLAMVGAGLITSEEALAAATTGAVPPAIAGVFGELPADQALAARITWATMSVAERHHSLITALIDAELATPEEVDAIFVTGATL